MRSLRTTNTVENLKRELRRRTKTQASFGTANLALIVLYGLVESPLRRLRRRNNFPRPGPRPTFNEACGSIRRGQS